MSLLLIFSKIFEKILSNQIVAYFEGNNLFTSSQFGFRAGKSATDATLTFVAEVTKALEYGEYCMVTFSDFCKAFDSVTHSKLKISLLRTDSMQIVVTL